MVPSSAALTAAVKLLERVSETASLDGAINPAVDNGIRSFLACRGMRLSLMEAQRASNVGRPDSCQ